MRCPQCWLVGVLGVAAVLAAAVPAARSGSFLPRADDALSQPETPPTRPAVQPEPRKVEDPMKDLVEKPAAKGPVYSRSAFDITPLSKREIDTLATKLTPEDAKVILAKGTEAAFCGNLLENHKDGVYTCKLCGLPLFSSANKFNSGTGWPSFYQPFDKDHIAYHKDFGHGMTRVEILCARCGAHLGHVFDDGPEDKTGLRYCLNSASLEFFEKGQQLPPASRPVHTEAAYFAGGCFWGVEDRFQQVPGVIDAVSGYMGGKKSNPSYEDVCTHSTGHAETVKVVYDPKRITYRQLLERFFQFHDPTQVNRQGPDIGDNYRSAIFAATPEQEAQAKSFIDEQSKNPRYKGKPIATQLASAKDMPFYEAEDYHQDYHLKHGGSCPIPEP
jgi:peptide methionine sulfoxide reductase msrA/msrB